jgi:hypothetical protein
VDNLEASIQLVCNASVSAMHVLSQVVDARQAELYIGTSVDFLHKAPPQMKAKMCLNICTFLN